MTTFSVLRTSVRLSTAGFNLNLLVDPTEQILAGVPPGSISIRLLNPSEIPTPPAPPGAYDGRRFRIVRTPFSGMGYSTDVYNGLTSMTALRTLLSGQWAEFVWVESESGWRLVAAGALS